MRTDKSLIFIFAFAGVFVGDAFYMLISRKRLRPTNFQRFLLGTGFVYMLTVTTELAKFFLDYYIPGFALQGYRLQPDLNSLFFRVFGTGAGHTYQYPMFEMDLNFITVVFGAACGGAVLSAALELVSLKTKNDRAFLYGARPEKRGFVGYLQEEYRRFVKTVSYPEYFSWWLVRIAMVGGLVRHVQNASFDISAVIMLVNLSVTFLIAPVRLLFFRNLFFGNIPYRVQTYINVFVFTGSFLGHGCGMNHSVPDFDKALHVLSGGLCVFIGYELLRGTRDARSLNKRTLVLGSAGFSAVVILVWEVFEFLADFYMKDSTNQNPYYDPAPDMFFFRIFGRGAGNPGQSPLLDTGVDITGAVFGCLICAAALSVWLRLREKKQAKKDGAERDGAKKKAALI